MNMSWEDKNSDKVAQPQDHIIKLNLPEEPHLRQPVMSLLQSIAGKVLSQIIN